MAGGGERGGGGARGGCSLTYLNVSSRETKTNPRNRCGALLPSLIATTLIRNQVEKKGVGKEEKEIFGGRGRGRDAKVTHACARISTQRPRWYLCIYWLSAAIIGDCSGHFRFMWNRALWAGGEGERRGGGEGWFSLGRFAPRCARESMNVNGGTDGEIRSDLLLVDLRYHFRRFEQSSSFFFFFYGLGWRIGRWNETGVFWRAG